MSLFPQDCLYFIKILFSFILEQLVSLILEWNDLTITLFVDTAYCQTFKDNQFCCIIKSQSFDTRHLVQDGWQIKSFQSNLRLIRVRKYKTDTDRKPMFSYQFIGVVSNITCILVFINTIPENVFLIPLETTIHSNCQLDLPKFRVETTYWVL